ncbi:MAG: hypothetical protein ACREEM_29330 [Blastocatellia bacterium]
MSRNRNQPLISASEVAEFVFCAKAWQLKRAGAAPQSPHLEPGKQFHQQHSAQVSSAARLRRLGVLCAALALLLLIAAALVRGFENLTR